MKNRDELAGWKTRAKKWITRMAVVMVTFGVIVATADAAVGKVNKLEKKLAKVEASIVAKQAKVVEHETELPIQEQALVDGQAAQAAAALLPRTTKAETKIAKKATKVANAAVKRATKRINKLTKKVAKLNNKIAEKLQKVAALEQKIDDLTVGGLPGEGNPGVEGLELPEQMTMVAAADVDDGPTGNDPQVGQGDSWAAGLGLPGQSDYFADDAHTWVYDPSMESLDSVNSILCMLRQTAHDAMVNEGAYVAQIDPNLCSNGGSNNGQQGEVEEVELWTVSSQRKNVDNDHVVGVWVPREVGDGPGNNDPAGTIHARMVIEEEPSEANPFGVFALDFEGVSDADPTGEPIFWGTMQTEDAATGVTGFSFYETSGVAGSNDFSERAVHVNINAAGEGVANVFETVTGDFGPGGSTQTEQGTFLLAFDDDNVLRQQDTSGQVCLDRNEFETSVWHYNLYEANGLQAGSLATRTSGFGIATADGDYGWAGYDGLWLPPQAQVLTGDTVVKNTFDSGDSPEQFTVMRAPGKLLRFSQNTLDLAGINGMQFEWYGVPSEVDPFGGDVGNPNGGSGQNDVVVSNYLVEYDHGSGEFTAIGKFDDDHQINLIYPVIVLDTAELGFLDLWSSALGGSVAYVYGDSEVTYFSEEIVSGNDEVFEVGGTLELYAYVDVLASEITGTDAQNGNVFLPDVTNVATPYAFVLDRDDLTLYHDVAGDGSDLDQVGLGVGETYESGPFSWGMRSGPMVTDTGVLSDALDVWNQEVFYVYETGPNDWNTHTALIDSEGDFIDFEPPIQFTYTHNVGQDRNGSSEYDGQVFQLQFHGPGELQGIPFEGVDTDGDGNDDRWYPVFNLADGTLVGPTGSEYLVRGIEMEQRLATDVGGCNALDLSGASVLDLPDGSGFEQPNLGNEPVVSGPPAVISGVVQED